MGAITGLARLFPVSNFSAAFHCQSRDVYSARPALVIPIEALLVDSLKLCAYSHLRSRQKS